MDAATYKFYKESHFVYFFRGSQYVRGQIASDGGLTDLTTNSINLFKDVGLPWSEVGAAVYYPYGEVDAPDGYVYFFEK